MTKIKDMLPEDVVEQVEAVAKEEITDASIIASMNVPFKPVADILLIKPLEKVTVSKTLTVMDDEANALLFKQAEEEGKQPEDVTLATREETKEVDSVQRIGIILSVSPKIASTYELKVGDKVVYNDRVSAPFDLMHNDAVYIRAFDVLGIWLK